mgnify:CR=1 FL=1
MSFFSSCELVYLHKLDKERYGISKNSCEAESPNSQTGKILHDEVTANSR